MRLLSPGQLPERNWEVQFRGEEGRRNLEHALLSRGRKLHEFVSPGDMGSLLESFFVAPMENGRGYTVSMLLTLSAWLEAYG